MLELKDLMPVNYLKKERFTGSYNGMRFCMEKAEHEGSDTMLAVVVWPEPYGYDATSEEQKTRIEYTFDADGIAKGVDWLNEQYASQAERWKKSSLR